MRKGRRNNTPTPHGPPPPPLGYLELSFLVFQPITIVRCIHTSGYLILIELMLTLESGLACNNNIVYFQKKGIVCF